MFLRSRLNHDNLGPDAVLSPFISIDKEGKHFYLKEIIVNGQTKWKRIELELKTLHIEMN